MRTPVLASAAGLLLETAAFAGGIDQSGQPVTLIFEKGDYAELSFGVVAPDIRGRDRFGTGSGNVYGHITDFGAGVKKELTPAWSVGLIVDQPYGLVVDYEPPGSGDAFLYAGTRAEPHSLGVTALARYRIDERLSVHGGLRAERLSAEVTLAGPAYDAVGLGGYNWDAEADWGLGYVVGGAFEIPRIALRVALTYGSEIEHQLDAQENFFGASTTTVTMPQSVNLDFQTGIAAETLLYGTVRWVNWDGWEVAPRGLALATGAPLVAFASDTFTFRLGVARQLTDALSAGIEVTHETSKGDMTSALEPYDGYTSLGVGAKYALRDGLTLSGSVAYTALGDADVETLTDPPARFRDNHAIGARLAIGMAF